MLRTFTVFLLLLIFSTGIFVSSTQAQENYNIPQWVKNSAKWWSEGQIGDSDFTKGIQYLIQQGIMKLPQTNSASNPSHGIPTWVKNNAKWWAEGQIDDSQFVQGMQYLVQADIIHVNTTQQANPTTNQPATSTITCNAINEVLPDPKCTPGATDPTVTQDNIDSTICVSGYTQTVRPPVSVTNPIKLEVMQAYGFADSPSNYELDHLIPLELGGAPADVRNLWPEPYYTNPNAYDKDGFENYLHNQVCSGAIDLQTAQNEIATNWVKYWEEDHSVTNNQPTQTVTNATSQASQTSTTQSSGPLHIDLQGQSTISRGSIQSITVTITDGKNPVSDASVSVLITYASGETTKNFDGTTDSNGQYSFSWRIGGNSTPGTFGVDVDASKNGYASDHEAFSFEVVPAS
ncbi:MAG: carboxypeptidase-like regulatory domain-containing protein [Nitrosotalea sp.]